MLEPLHYEDEEDRIPGLAKAFGAVLRRHRRALGLSQEVFAIQTGLDRTYISMLERGVRRPSLTTLFVLARRFGVKASTFVSEFEDSV